MNIGLHIYETPLGWSGIAWSDAGIVAAQLWDRDAETVRRSMQRRVPEAVEQTPPDHVVRAAEGVAALFAGEKRDLSGVQLDWSRVEDFQRQVYEIARAIPPGETLTYGDVAKKLGDVALSRAVGAALGRNPYAPIVPCHRVLAAGGKTGGFSAPGGVETKLRLLNIERAGAGDGLFGELPLATKSRPRGAAPKQS
jgi:methylated-DNA-[protein]-cysteine S-methyltransferase